MEKIKEKFNPLVSIIIPVYNGANYMREAIDSALAQTYKNIEVIVVNDGSTDNTDEIAKSYGDRIRYFKKENGGVATALNLAIEKSKGEYISWLSHDDVYYLDKIEKQIKKLSELSKSESLNTILMSNYSLINEKSEITFIQKFHKIHDLKKLNYPLYPLLKGIVHGCTLLIPKHCFEDVGYFDSKLKATQDYDLWFKMFPKYKMLFMSNLFVKSRWHPEQGSKNIDTVNQESDELWIRMIKNLTDEQKIAIDDSVLFFYQKTYDIVSAAKYLGAEKYLFKLLESIKQRDISKIKVSVIIPFFNRINWTVEAIESVTAQTHKNLEIIVVDDNSTDDIQLIRNIATNDKRIKLIKNERRKGVSGARNTGIDIASGEYIAFLDSDDLFVPQKIEKQLEFMVRNGYLFTHTSYSLFTKINSRDNVIESGNVDYLYPDIIAGCAIATPTVMINMELFKNKDNRFPEKYSVGEDVCFWTMISRISPCKGVKDALTRVRRHECNAAYDTAKQIQGINNILDYAITNFLDKNTVEHIKKLNQGLIHQVDKCYKKEDLTKDQGEVKHAKAVEEKSFESIPAKVSFKNEIRKILRWFIFTISPTFRMLSGNRHRMNILLEKIENLERINRDQKSAILDVHKKQSDIFLEKLDKIEKINEQRIADALENKIRKEYLSKAYDENINLLGEKIFISDNHRSLTKNYKLSIVDFFEELKKTIFKTDVVLDIGCGIRPQTFFTPKIHICIEPFEQYREMIKPLFPNNSHFVFLKEDALNAIKTLDNNSVDTVFMIDLIEHLEKEDGLALLKEADRVARKQIIVFTPLGFYPMHFKEENQRDAWGLNGNDVQEHKSGWLPEDFGESWDFHICEDCHDAFLSEEKEQGKKYSALMAIKTKNFKGFPIMDETPEFVNEVYRDRVIDK